MAKQRIGWPYPGLLDQFAIVVSREQCQVWYQRIQEGESPLILGLLPPVPKEYLQHVGVQIRLSTQPPLTAHGAWMFLEPRWVN